MLPIEKLEAVVRRQDEIERLMCEPGVATDRAKLTSLGRERGQIMPLVDAFREWQGLSKRIREDKDALDDPELGELVREELPELEQHLADVEKRIKLLLVPKDPN